MNSSLPDMFRRYPRIRQLSRRLLGLVPLAHRLGKEFWDWYAFYEESERWSFEELESYQLERLRTLLQDVVRSSSFYRERITDASIDELQSIADFQKVVPTIARREYRQKYSEILSNEWQKQDLVQSSTSGTTGMALQFFHATKDGAREWASICHQWKRVGYIPGQSRRAEFRGLTRAGIPVEFYPQRNMLRCSILNFKPESIRMYGEAIQREGITFYHGYPSAVYLLARSIIGNKIRFPQPKAILLASEMVLDHQLDGIKMAFPEAKIFAHYGCAERTVLAGWCEGSRAYHVLPQYALVEIDPKTSEVIGTNLYNTSNAFIRYRMTDTVLDYVETACPECGREYQPRIARLGGRMEDYLYSVDGGWIPPAIVTYPLKDLSAIQELQFVQNVPDRVVIRYTLTDKHAEGEEERDIASIRSGIRNLLGKSTRIEFVQVEAFERTPAGKYRWIINTLDISSMEV